MDFKQSKTYQNLIIAFQEELMASTRYSIFSDIARNVGYIEISNIFDISVRNEKEHARIWLRRLHQGVLPSLSEVLQESSQYENDIASKMYRNFAQTAREEGYNDIASLFNGVANIDLYHSQNYSTLYSNVISDKEFCKVESTLWICLQCGNILSGECAPVICPVCGFPQGYYKLLNKEVIY